MKRDFSYQPTDHELETASNSYVMSLVAVIAGLPFPIINLFATLFFFLGNRKGTYFVRWHCTQALFSQFSLVFMNSAFFWWTFAILFDDKQITSLYVAYLFTVLLFNLAEFVATIRTAVATRKGRHIEWWFYGDLTNLVCKPGKGGVQRLFD